MGYKLVTVFQINKQSFVTILLQMIVTIGVGWIYFVLNWPILLILIPILNTIIICILYKNIGKPQKIILTWLVTFVFLVAGLVFMHVRNSFLGTSLLFFVHFYSITLPYLFATFYFWIKNKHHKNNTGNSSSNTGDGSLEKTGDGSLS